MNAMTWSDERLERRENELSYKCNELGHSIASERCLLARLTPDNSHKRAIAQVKLVYELGALAEIREVRRILLGLTHNAHIRGRALPNFVADNPGYAECVADEVPEARMVVDRFTNGVPRHE